MNRSMTEAGCVRAMNAEAQTGEHGPARLNSLILALTCFN
jgi:hypothetical protein